MDTGLEQDYKQLNTFENFFSWQSTWDFLKFVHCEHRVIGYFTGNQRGKTGGTAYQYVMRILGMHPVAKKNVLYFECEEGHMFSPTQRPEDGICPKCGKELRIHRRKSKAFRFCSETLPNDKETTGEDGASAETKNTVYPEFKKWLPDCLIQKDITFRNATMTVKDPFAGTEFGDEYYSGDDIVVEFVSYNQSTQATAGVQRMSIWCDEEPPSDFYKEQLPRLLAEDGDIIISLTPANYISWTYDEVFEKAAVYYRSKAICEYLSTSTDRVEQVQHTDSLLDIAVIQAATDDNPTLSIEVIEEMFTHYDDPDDIAIRRYGIFKQVSGRIFKDFDYHIHYVDDEEYFPDGIPYAWRHGRGIDYHPQTPWAYGSISLSPTNEAFIWGELSLSPEKYTTAEIMHEVALRSGDYNFALNLIDPLSETIKKDSISVLDDVNKEFQELKKEGLCTGGYWSTWDTKGEKGRDEIKKRLKNSKLCSKPFNNMVIQKGLRVYLPTIWILKPNKISAKSMRQWRWEEWSDPKSRNTKDAKNAPMQKFSHQNMVWEALLKNPAFKPKVERVSQPKKAPSYFKRKTRVR